jgi:hypothetical protein
VVVEALVEVKGHDSAVGAADALAFESGPDHERIVDDQGIARPEQARQIGDASVLQGGALSARAERSPLPACGERVRVRGSQRLCGWSVGLPLTPALSPP